MAQFVYDNFKTSGGPIYRIKGHVVKKSTANGRTITEANFVSLGMNTKI